MRKRKQYPRLDHAAVFLLLICPAWVGCVKMAYLPTDQSVAYPPSSQVEILWKEPERPYTVIGRVSAASSDYGEEELFRRIQERARKEGAQAIIMAGTEESGSVVGIPQATGGTLIVPTTRRKLQALAIRWVDENFPATSAPRGPPE